MVDKYMLEISNPKPTATPIKTSKNLTFNTIHAFSTQ